MLIRYLKPVSLMKAEKEKQANGAYVNTYTKVDDYRITEQTLESDVDAQIYGADVNKMLRLTSPNNKLEKELLSKLNNEADNISKYYIFDNGVKYKVVAVTPGKIDVSRIGGTSGSVSL